MCMNMQVKTIQKIGGRFDEEEIEKIKKSLN